MGVTELNSLGIKAITSPQWINAAITPAALNIPEFSDVRFALGAEERTAVAILRFEHSTNGIGATGESQIAAILADPDATPLTKAALVIESRLIFYDERTFRVVTTGGTMDRTAAYEPNAPYITLRDVRLVALSITNVDENLVRMQYQYVSLSEKAFQAILGRNLR